MVGIKTTKVFKVSRYLLKLKLKLKSKKHLEYP